MKHSIDDTAGYLERLKPLYVRLFRVAHGIAGNREVAEYVLKSAIVEAYLRRNEWRDRMGFQEGLLHTIRAVALVELKGVKQAGAFETDWTLPVPGKLKSAAEQALYARLQRESEATQRIAVLFFGCGMTPAQIGQVMDARAIDVNGRLRRLTSRLLRSVKLNGRRGRSTLEEQMEWIVQAALEAPGEDVAEMGAVFRSFERDVDGARKPRASTGRIVAITLKALGAVALALLFWLLAVLVQPQAHSGEASGTRAPTSQNQNLSASSADG